MTFVGPLDNVTNNRLGAQAKLSPLTAATEAAGTFAAKIVASFSGPEAVRAQNGRTQIENSLHVALGVKPGSPEALPILSRYLGASTRSLDQSA